MQTACLKISLNHRVSIIKKMNNFSAPFSPEAKKVGKEASDLGLCSIMMTFSHKDSEKWGDFLLSLQARQSVEVEACKASRSQSAL